MLVFQSELKNKCSYQLTIQFMKLSYLQITIPYGKKRGHL